MQNFITVNVPPDLLPQVTGELLQFTRNPDLVQVAFSEVGRVIHADPDVVDAWMDWRAAKEAGTATKVAEAESPVTEQEPEHTVVEPEPGPEPEPEPVDTVPSPVVPEAIEAVVTETRPVARKK